MAAGDWNPEIAKQSTEAFPMTTLTTRLSQATEPTSELLWEVFNLVHPPRQRSDAEWEALGDVHKAFTAAIDANAWTSAVEMLTGKESTALADAIACLKARGL